jgi:hypothetical protein
MSEQDVSNSEFKSAVAGIVADALERGGLKGRRSTWRLRGDDVQWVATVDRVPHLPQVHVIVGLDLDVNSTSGANYCPVVTSAARLARSQGLDPLELDWALNGSTPMELPERREVIEATIERVVALLQSLRSASAVREAYASGDVELGFVRPDARAFLEGDAEVWEPSPPLH